MIWVLVKFEIYLFIYKKGVVLVTESRREPEKLRSKEIYVFVSHLLSQFCLGVVGLGGSQVKTKKNLKMGFGYLLPHLLEVQ